MWKSVCSCVCPCVYVSVRASEWVKNKFKRKETETVTYPHLFMKVWFLSRRGQQIVCQHLLAVCRISLGKPSGVILQNCHFNTAGYGWMERVVMNRNVTCKEWVLHTRTHTCLHAWTHTYTHTPLCTQNVYTHVQYKHAHTHTHSLSLSPPSNVPLLVKFKRSML